MQVILSKLLPLFSKVVNPTAKNLIGYSSLTYSITGLLVLLGLAGKHDLVSDFALVQGAALATFYVLSGDARHLILTGQLTAYRAIYFRLICLLPIASAAFLMTLVVGKVNIALVVGLILRRSCEWLAEVHVTEIERKKKIWRGWFFQPIIFSILFLQLASTNQTWFIWIWALSPIFFSLEFLLKAEQHNFLKLSWENLISTSIIGFTGYVQRVLILGMVGKDVAGMLFPGYAIGSFVGTLAANVVGPTVFSKKNINMRYFYTCLLLMSVVGLAIYKVSDSLLYSTIGLSVIGGAAMIAAQQARLSSLSTKHMLEMDLLLHMVLVFSLLFVYYAGGLKLISANYMVGAIIAWVFYKGSVLAVNLNNKNRTIIFILITLGLVFPVFFQLNGSIYNSWMAAVTDSKGMLQNVPLPFSIISCYLGVLIFTAEYKQSKPVIMAIAGMFLILTFSAMVTNKGLAKLFLIAQYMLPTAALLLGLALANFNQKLLAKVILYFLTFFVPTQLFLTWIQGQLALTHYFYYFSVYQHYQYVPLVLAGLFAWVWLELRESHLKHILALSPFMGLYVAAGNSILALFGLVVFSVAFAFSNRKKKAYLLVPIFTVASIVGYFYINSQLAGDIRLRNEDGYYSSEGKYMRHGVFVSKLFDMDGCWLYSETECDKNHFHRKYNKEFKLPENLSERGDIALIYVKAMLKNPASILIGHDSPPPRKLISSAHNYYLDLTYNFGIIACIPILVLLMYTISLTRRNAKYDQSLMWFLAVVCYFVVIDNNMKVTLRQPYSGIVVFFLWGVLLSKLSWNAHYDSTIVDESLVAHVNLKNDEIK